MQTLVRIAALAAAASILTTPALAADQNAALAPMTPVEAMAALSERGLTELHAITPADGAYRVVVKDGAGRLRDLEMDAATGALDVADTGGIYSNWIDPELFVRLRGSLSPSLPAAARPAHELATGLMQSGQYAELQEMRYVDDAYVAKVRDHQGMAVEVRIDPVSGNLIK